MPTPEQDWRCILPGVPLVESPWFDRMLPSLGPSAEEQRIAVDLHNLGDAVFDLPNPELP